MKKKKDKPVPGLECSFCGKGQKDVKAIIAGPAVYICSECVELCIEILQDEHKWQPEALFVRHDKDGKPQRLMIDVHTGAKVWVHAKTTGNDAGKSKSKDGHDTGTDKTKTPDSEGHSGEEASGDNGQPASAERVQHGCACGTCGPNDGCGEAPKA